MRIFLAGATGAVGKQLVPLLREAGHVVVGTTRSPEKAGQLRAQGVQAAILDALDGAATLRAVTSARPDAIVLADDEPAPVREWLPLLADAVGAPPPRRVPSWLARVLIGRHGVAMMNENRGLSSAKAKSTLGWRPRYASWRMGFVEGLG